MYPILFLKIKKEEVQKVETKQKVKTSEKGGL